MPMAKNCLLKNGIWKQKGKSGFAICLEERQHLNKDQAVLLTAVAGSSSAL